MASEATAPSSHPSRLAKLAPIFDWLPSYDRGWLRLDVLAGLTLWGMVVPEAMAYAGIAGLPPEAGLYTLVATLLVYAIFGTSRHLVVAATSATAALLAATVVAFGVSSGDAEMYQAYATAFVLVVGVVFLVAGLARLGFITQFLSKPVMDGFVTGLAIFVAVGQLNKLFGVEKGEGNVIEKLLTVISELPEANWVTFAVGASALALLFILPRLNKKLPAGLIVLFSYIILSLVLDLEGNFGVEVVGTLPQGLPRPTLPQDVPLEAWVGMILPAIGVLLLAYSESLGISREFAEKHGYEVDANQELNAHSFANLASGFFGGMIAGGSMSASAVKESAGARTQVSNLVAWVATIVTLLFLTPLFAPLPEAVLAALIIHAVWHIISSRKLQHIRAVAPAEFWLGALTFAGVIFIDVLQGMIIGLIASTLLMIYRSSRPHLSSLGRTPEHADVYSDLERHPENEPVSDVLIVRLDAPMYYANALTVRDEIKELVVEGDPAAVVLDAETQDELDYTTFEVLTGMVRELKAKEVAVYVAVLHEPILEFSRRTDLHDLIGEENVYPSVDEAVKAAERAMESS